MKVAVVLGTILAVGCVDAASARTTSDKERLRQQAEHLCYNDVQRLCGDAIPDEGKIQACMSQKRARLSAPCRKVFDEGI